jgi:hypothetical protein
MKLYVKFFILFMTIWLMGASCLPAVVPTEAPTDAGVQRFVDRCEEGYWNGAEIAHRAIVGVPADSCSTYTLVNFKPVEAKTARISGLDLAINYECVTIGSIVTDVNIYERIKCSFPTSSNVLNLYMQGEDIRVITELVVDGSPIYFPPVGVEDEQSP